MTGNLQNHDHFNQNCLEQSHSSYDRIINISYDPSSRSAEVETTPGDNAEIMQWLH